MHTYKNFILVALLSVMLSCGSSGTSGGGVAPTSPAETPITLSFSAGDVIITGTLDTSTASISKAANFSTSVTGNIYAINTQKILDGTASASDVIFAGTFEGDEFSISVPGYDATNGMKAYLLLYEDADGRISVWEYDDLALSSVPVLDEGESAAGSIEVESGASILSALQAAALSIINVGTLTPTFNDDITIGGSTVPITGTMTSSGLTATEFQAQTGWDPDVNLIQLVDGWMKGFINIADYQNQIYETFEPVFSFESTAGITRILSPSLQARAGVYFQFEPNDQTLSCSALTMTSYTAAGVEKVLNSKYSDGEAPCDNKTNRVYFFYGGGDVLASSDLSGKTTYIIRNGSSDVYIASNVSSEVGIESLNIYPKVVFDGGYDSVLLTFVTYNQDTGVETALTGSQISEAITSPWIMVVTTGDEELISTDAIDLTSASNDIRATRSFTLDEINYVYVSITYKGSGVKAAFNW